MSEQAPALRPGVVKAARPRPWREASRIALLRALVALLPARPHAVVAGVPDDEGNSVEVVRALVPHLRVYWLVTDDPESLSWLLPEYADHPRLRVVRRDSARAYLAYATARWVFFTHGLYGSPRPPRRKTFVNLWHGDGPKQRKGFADIASTYVVSGTELWGRPRAASFHVPDRNVLVTGNPRLDQLASAATPEQLGRLGLCVDRPLVLWLPTYRTTDYRDQRLGAVRNWSDGAELSGADAVQGLLQRVAAVADSIGVTVVVKPHRLDADRYAGTGIRCVTSEELQSARTTLYQLLGRSSGLVTDYSSVWTDYLATGRPIGFFCPDLDRYEEVRGLNVVDYLSLIPGPRLEGVDDFARFLQGCLADPDPWREQRARCAARIGARTERGATARLLQALGIGSGSPDAGAP